MSKTNDNNNNTENNSDAHQEEENIDINVETAKVVNNESTFDSENLDYHNLKYFENEAKIGCNMTSIKSLRIEEVNFNIVMNIIILL